MIPVFGDIYDINRLVREYDESYRLSWNDRLKRHQVVSTKRKALYEGVHDGHPLYSLRDVDEVVFTCEPGTPDMRVMWHLHETDVWRYPGGPKAFYDDMVRDSEIRQQKRTDEQNDMVDYVAKEHHHHVFDTKKSYLMNKVV